MPETSVDSCAAGLLERLRARAERNRQRAVELRRQAELSARQLGASLGARRVWLFGSLAWAETHAGSDVDVLVEGIPPHAWDEAVRIIEELIDAPVDLVRAEEAGPELLDRVRRDGVLLYERG